MASHDDLLAQGPRDVSAAQPSRRHPLMTAVGVVIAAALVIVHGIFGKLVIVLLAWEGIRWATHHGGWVGIALTVAIVLVALSWLKVHLF